MHIIGALTPKVFYAHFESPEFEFNWETQSTAKNLGFNGVPINQGGNSGDTLIVPSWRDAGRILVARDQKSGSTLGQITITLKTVSYNTGSVTDAEPVDLSIPATTYLLFRLRLNTV